jgi:RHS repeat-associated protein
VSTHRELRHAIYDYNRNNSAGNLSGQTGQVTKVLNNRDHNKDREFQYDTLGRLTTAKGGSTAIWQEHYSFDRWGNRTAVTSSGTAADGSTIPNDGIPSLSYNTGSNRIAPGSGYEYDVAGNQTRALSQDGTNFIRYEYDAANRPVNIKDDSGNLIQSQQFGEGNDRISLTDPSANQITYYDGPTEYTEFGGNGVLIWTRSIVYFGDTILSTTTPDGSGGESIPEYNHPDRLGSRMFSWTNGTYYVGFTEQAHLPFGGALNAESSKTNFSKRYTSYERSAATGLDYAQNRTYDSKQGRFTQVDPIGMGDASLGNPQSLNLYSYCYNDPINHTDPSGLGFFSFLKKLFKWVVTAIAVIAAVVAVIAAIYVTGGALGLAFAEGGMLGGIGASTGLLGVIAAWGNAALSIKHAVGSIAGHFAQTKDDPKFKKDFYAKYAAALNASIKTIFGKDSKKIPEQTIGNAPAVDRSQTGTQLANKSIVKGQISAINSLPMPNNGPRGTVAIANDTFKGVDMTLPGNKETVFDSDAHAYTHELGNILSYKVSKTRRTAGDYNKYGDPNGIANSGGYKDKDTGAALEKCVFGTLH